MKKYVFFDRRSLECCDFSQLLLRPHTFTSLSPKLTKHLYMNHVEVFCELKRSSEVKVCGQN